MAWSSDSIFEGGHRLICSCEFSKYVGVVVLVHQKWTKSILKVEQVSDRVMYVDIEMEHIVVRVVATYFPHVVIQFLIIIFVLTHCEKV